MSKPSKAERRELRRLAKQEKFKKKTAQIIEKLGDSAKELRIKDIAPLIRTPRTAVEISSDTSKKPRITRDPDDLIRDLNMAWCTANADRVDEWSWRELRDWTDEEWANDIFPALSEMEQNTWHNILYNHKVTVGPKDDPKQVPKHHYHEVGDLCNEAKNRWLDLGLYEYDTAFRFRFGGTKRAWGICKDGHFYLIWWERYHKIYPVEKRHT